MIALAACGSPASESVEPPRILDRVYDASIANDVDAIAYVTREMRRRSGPGRTSRRYEHYTVTVRRLPDGLVVGDIPLADSASKQLHVAPEVLGVVDGVIWLRRDSMVGYQLPTLTPVALPADGRTDSPATAALRTRITSLTTLPVWEKPGMARLSTSVSTATELVDGARALRLSMEPDSTWTLRRLSADSVALWSTPLALRFALSIVVLHTPAFVVFMDSESTVGRSGTADKLVWVNVTTGAAQMLDVAAGTVTSLPIQPTPHRKE